MGRFWLESFQKRTLKIIYIVGIPNSLMPWILYQKSPLHILIAVTFLGIPGSVHNTTTCKIVKVPHTKATSKDMKVTSFLPSPYFFNKIFLKRLLCHILSEWYGYLYLLCISSCVLCLKIGEARDLAIISHSLATQFISPYKVTFISTFISTFIFPKGELT